MPQLLVIGPAEKEKVFNRFPKDNKNNVHESIKRTSIDRGKRNEQTTQQH